MKKIRIYFYYWFVSIFFLLYGFSFKMTEDALIDINVHDTYYVISNWHASILVASFYGLIGFIYFILRSTKANLIKILTNVHSIITLGIIPIYFIGYFILSTRKHSQFPLFDDTTDFNLFLFVIASVLLVSQAFLILNILISLIKFLSNRNA